METGSGHLEVVKQEMARVNIDILEISEVRWTGMGEFNSDDQESYDQPRQYIQIQRHYFAYKGPSSLGYGFPVVTYGCESWTVKKAERRRIDAFELWCWRRLLRVPWTARRSKQSILKEISPGCSLEGLMLKLKLQYFGHLMQ